MGNQNQSQYGMAQSSNILLKNQDFIPMNENESIYRQNKLIKQQAQPESINTLQKQEVFEENIKSQQFITEKIAGLQKQIKQQNLKFESLQNKINAKIEVKVDGDDDDNNNYDLNESSQYIDEISENKIQQKKYALIDINDFQLNPDLYRNSSKENNILQDEFLNKRIEAYDDLKKKFIDGLDLEVDEDSINNSQDRLSLLKKLVLFTQNNEKVACEIENKDVVILIGTTSAGKSTVMNYLAERKLVFINKEEFDKGLNDMIVKKYIDVQDKETCVSNIGHKFHSETKCLNSYGIKRGEGKEIILCDSPRFEDSDGLISEIANSTGIIKALYMAKSVKIVLVINSEQLQIASKGDLIKKLVSLFTKLFKDKETCEKSILIIVTKMEQKNIYEDIYSKLGILSESLKNEQEKSFVLQFLKNCFFEEKQSIAFQPFNVEHIPLILNKIQMIPSIPNNKIKDCIQYSITSQRKQKLDQILKELLADLDIFLEEKSVYKIDVLLSYLKILIDSVNIASFQEFYKLAIEKIEGKQEVKLFQGCLQNFVSDNHMKQASIMVEKLIEAMEYAISIEGIKRNNPGYFLNVSSFDDILELVTTALNTIYDNAINSKSYHNTALSLEKLKFFYSNKELQAMIKSNQEIILGKMTKDQSNKQYKMKSNNVFSQDLYEAACSIIKEQYKTIILKLNKMSQNISKQNIQNIITYFDSLKEFVQFNLKEHISINCEGIYKRFKKQYKLIIETFTSELQSIDFQNLAKAKQLLANFSQRYQILIEISLQQQFLTDHFPNENVDIAIDHLRSYYVEKCNEILQQGSLNHKLRQKKDSFLLVNQFRTIDNKIKEKTEQQYLNLQLDVKNVIQTKQEKAINLINEINQLLCSSSSKVQLDIQKGFNQFSDFENQFNQDIQQLQQLQCRNEQQEQEYVLKRIQMKFKSLCKCRNKISDTMWCNQETLYNAGNTIFYKFQTKLKEMQDEVLNDLKNTQIFEKCLYLIMFRLNLLSQDNRSWFNEIQIPDERGKLVSFLNKIESQIVEMTLKTGFQLKDDYLPEQDKIQLIEKIITIQSNLFNFVNNLQSLLNQNILIFQKDQSIQEFVKNINKHKQVLTKQREITDNSLIQCFSKNIYNPQEQSSFDNISLNFNLQHDTLIKLQLLSQFPNVKKIYSENAFLKLQVSCANNYKKIQEDIQEAFNKNKDPSGKNLEIQINNLKEAQPLFEKFIKGKVDNKYFKIQENYELIQINFQTQLKIMVSEYKFQEIAQHIQKINNSEQVKMILQQLEKATKSQFKNVSNQIKAVNQSWDQGELKELSKKIIVLSEIKKYQKVFCFQSLNITEKVTEIQQQCSQILTQLCEKIKKQLDKQKMKNLHEFISRLQVSETLLAPIIENKDSKFLQQVSSIFSSKLEKFEVDIQDISKSEQQIKQIIQIYKLFPPQNEQDLIKFLKKTTSILAKKCKEISFEKFENMHVQSIEELKMQLKENFFSILEVCLLFEKDSKPEDIFNQCCKEIEDKFENNKEQSQARNSQYYKKFLERHNNSKRAFSKVEDELIKIYQETKEKDISSKNYLNCKNNILLFQDISKSLSNVFPNVDQYLNNIILILDRQFIKSIQNLESVIYKIDCSNAEYLIIFKECAEIFLIFHSISEFSINPESFVDMIQKALQNYQEEINKHITAFDPLNSYLAIKIIQFIHNQSIQFDGKNINLLAIIKNILEKQPFEKSSKKHKLIEVINQGSWDLNGILDKIYLQVRKMREQIQALIESKQYKQILEINKQYQVFVNKIEPFYKDLNNQSILEQVINHYKARKNIAEGLLQSNKIDFSLNLLLIELQELENIFQEFFPEISKVKASKTILLSIKSQVDDNEKRILKLTIEKESQIALKQFVQGLLDIRRIGHEIGGVNEYSINKISAILQKKEMNINREFQNAMSNVFKESELGNLIIKENRQFFSYQIIQIMKDITKNQHHIDYINNMMGVNLNRYKIHSSYQLYENKYTELFKQWSKNEIDLSDVIRMSKVLVKKINSNFNASNQKQINWSPEQQNQIITLLSHLSLTWSILDCKNRIEEVRILHIVQVAAIIRLLCLDPPSQKLENNIVEIKTGEGKSIVLAISSIIFALLGFKVDCCCYSSLLSERDFKDFLNYFRTFEVESQINYSTFEKIVEKFINNPYSIRDLANAYFKGDLKNELKKLNKNQSQNNKEQKQILLIDEVDFFFSDNFMGEIYNVSVKETYPEIGLLLNAIWRDRYNIQYEEFKNNSPEYKQLFSKNPHLNQRKALIDNTLKRMIEDSKKMETHNYLTYIPEDKSKTLIGYKDRVGVSVDIVKGYMTAYAYIQEWSKKVIDEATLNENLSMSNTVAAFSYAEIPKLYDLVCGVTGTYKDMNDQQKQQLADLFLIEKYTISPSIYGHSKLSFNEIKDVNILPNQQLWLQAINRSAQNIVKDSRSCIIFFESKYEIELYTKQYPNEGYQILKEESNNKYHIITKASSSRIITLTTKYFGRGTDFICFDQQVLNNGGVHVIQTFFSQELSEETQIKGRTGRQSQKGSYELIIETEALTSMFQINKNEIPQNPKNVYSFLSKIRNQRQNSKVPHSSIKVYYANKCHALSLEIRKSLFSYNDQNNDKLILQKLEELSLLTKDEDQRSNTYLFQNMNEGIIGLENNSSNLYKYYGLIQNKFIIPDFQTSGKSIIFAVFFNSTGEPLLSYLQNLTIPCLKEKGYDRFLIVETEMEFIKNIDNFQQVWIFSSDKFHNPEIQTEFVESIQKHLKKQRGLMIWADNDPFFVHANLILSKIPVGYYNQKEVKIKLAGDNYGNKILQRGVSNKRQQFGSHLITTGLTTLHEGVTICYPQVISDTPKDYFGDIQIVGTSSDNVPCMFVLNAAKDRGRIVFDCGFTKLFPNHWDSARTVRYVKNCYVWLYFMEALEEDNCSQNKI